jgi:hypothetical protein
VSSLNVRFEQADMLKNRVQDMVITESACFVSHSDEVFEHPAVHYMEVGPSKARSAQLSRTHCNDGAQNCWRYWASKLLLQSIIERTPFYITIQPHWCFPSSAFCIRTFPPYIYIYFSFYLFLFFLFFQIYLLLLCSDRVSKLAGVGTAAHDSIMHCCCCVVN